MNIFFDIGLIFVAADILGMDPNKASLMSSVLLGVIVVMSIPASLVAGIIPHLLVLLLSVLSLHFRLLFRYTRKEKYSLYKYHNNGFWLHCFSCMYVREKGNEGEDLYLTVSFL